MISRINADEVCHIKLEEFICDVKSGVLVFEPGVTISDEREELKRRCGELFSEYKVDVDIPMRKLVVFLLDLEMITHGLCWCVFNQLVQNRKITNNNIDELNSHFQQRIRVYNIAYQVLCIAIKPPDVRIMWFLNKTRN